MDILYIIMSISLVGIGIVTFIRAVMFRDRVGKNLNKYTIVILQKEALLKMQFFYAILLSLLKILTGIILFLNHKIYLLTTLGVILSTLYNVYIKMLISKGYVEFK